MKRKIICAVILTMSVLALTGCKKKKRTDSTAGDTDSDRSASCSRDRNTGKWGNTRRGSTQLLYWGMD